MYIPLFAVASTGTYVVHCDSVVRIWEYARQDRVDWTCTHQDTSVLVQSRAEKGPVYFVKTVLLLCCEYMPPTMALCTHAAFIPILMSREHNSLKQYNKPQRDMKVVESLVPKAERPLYRMKGTATFTQ